MTQFEIGSQWRANSGHRAVVVKLGENGFFKAWHDLELGKLVQHYPDGRALRPILINHYSLIAPWREPESGVCWVHVSRFLEGSLHTLVNDEPLYSHGFSGKLIARIRVPWKEGQFDEPEEGGGDV